MQQSFTGHPHLRASAADTRFEVLGAISFSRFLDAMVQSLVRAFLRSRA